MKTKTAYVVVCATLGFLTAPMSAHGAYQTTDFTEAMRFADRFAALDKFDQAAAYYQQAARLSPGRAEPEVRLGILEYGRGRYGRARDHFDRAVGLKTDGRTRPFLNTALDWMKHDADLLAQIERSSAAGAQSTELAELHRRAAEQLAQGKVYMGLLWPHLDYLARADTDGAVRYWRVLADGFFQSSDPIRALPYYRKVVAASKPSVPLYERLAECLVNTGFFDEAGVNYRKALREAVRRKQTSEIRRIHKLIGRLPRSSQLVLRLLEDEEYEAAYKELKRFTTLNPSDPWAMTMMGSVYEEIGYAWQAERLYRKAIKNFPEYPGAHYAMGRYYLLKKKDTQKALEELKRFKEALSEARAWIEPPNQIKVIEENNLQAVRHLVYIYAQVLKEPQKALAELEGYLQGCVENAPENAEIYFDLGCVYWELKKRTMAFQAFRKTIELKPDSDL
ncbi:MAG: tetratricopeptide repeat protein, partial [Candidatus Omnitrophota bacterium]